MLVSPTFPGNRISDLIRVAKQQPGKLSYASAGVGTVPHLAAELLKQRLGLDLIHIPYRGSAPALTDLMSGQVQVYIDLVLSAQSHVRAGTVKALGITTKTRLSEFPEIPTLEEQGVNDYEVTSWFGIVARADVPDAVAVRLNAAVDQVLQIAEVRDRFVSTGAIPIGGSPDLFREMIETEYRMWGPVISAAGIALGREVVRTWRCSPGVDAIDPKPSLVPSLVCEPGCELVPGRAAADDGLNGHGLKYKQKQPAEHHEPADAQSRTLANAAPNSDSAPACKTCSSTPSVRAAACI